MYIVYKTFEGEACFDKGHEIVDVFWCHFLDLKQSALFWIYCPKALLCLMHIKRINVTRSWTSSNSTYIIVGSCNSYLTRSKHWTCHLLNIAGLQHAVPSNQLFEIYHISCLFTQQLSKLHYDSLGCHILWWHWQVLQTWLQFFQKLLNDGGLDEMALSPFRCVVHHQWPWKHSNQTSWP